MLFSLLDLLGKKSNDMKLFYFMAVLFPFQGSVAKKPYNPILGEMFLCSYDLTEDNSENKVWVFMQTSQSSIEIFITAQVAKLGIVEMQ